MPEVDSSSSRSSAVATSSTSTNPVVPYPPPFRRPVFFTPAICACFFHLRGLGVADFKSDEFGRFSARVTSRMTVRVWAERQQEDFSPLEPVLRHRRRIRFFFPRRRFSPWCTVRGVNTRCTSHNLLRFLDETKFTRRCCYDQLYARWRTMGRSTRYIYK